MTAAVRRAVVPAPARYPQAERHADAGARLRVVGHRRREGWIGGQQGQRTVHRRGTDEEAGEAFRCSADAGAAHITDVLQVRSSMWPVGGAGEEHGPQDSGGARLPKRRASSPAKSRSHGASNIGLQFRGLYEGKSRIREMTGEEVEFKRLNVAPHACSGCDSITEGIKSPGVADTTPYFTVHVFTVAKVKQTPVRLYLKEFR